VVGSLLLGLYDSDGFLHHVGFTSTIPRDDKKALTVKLKNSSHLPDSPAIRRAARADGPPNDRRNGSP
jgi:ATP-dependent DNA ligase